jgi:starch synthase
LKYGTVPIVRATGGLSDTIANATDEALASGTATGFAFREYSALALSETLSRACEVYRNPELWHQLMQQGMRQDWSWANSAAEYSRLYKSTIARIRQRVFS